MEDGEEAAALRAFFKPRAKETRFRPPPPPPPLLTAIELFHAPMKRVREGAPLSSNQSSSSDEEGDVTTGTRGRQVEWTKNQFCTLLVRRDMQYTAAKSAELSYISGVLTYPISAEFLFLLLVVPVDFRSHLRVAKLFDLSKDCNGFPGRPRAFRGFTLDKQSFPPPLPSCLEVVPSPIRLPYTPVYAAAKPVFWKREGSMV